MTSYPMLIVVCEAVMDTYCTLTASTALASELARFGAIPGHVARFTAAVNIG